MTRVDYAVILPEILLAVYAMLALIGAVYAGKDQLHRLLTWATAGVMVLLALWIGYDPRGHRRSASAACSSTTPSPASPR